MSTMRKTLVVALALLLAFGALGALADTELNGIIYDSGNTGATDQGVKWFTVVKSCSANIVDAVIVAQIGDEPKFVTSVTDDAFADCATLETVVFPTSAYFTSIGSRAFANCVSLETVFIPDSVTGLGSHAFVGCTRLTGVRLSPYLSAIPDYGFKDCASLEEFEYTPENTLLGSGGHHFQNCTSLKRIAVPRKNTTETGVATFMGCTALEEVELHDGIKSISTDSFRECVSLQRIDLPEGLKGLYDYAFYNCDSLKTVEIPEGLTKMGQHVFEECDSLETITLLPRLNEKGEYIFANCRTLESAYINMVGNRMFSCDVALREVTFGADFGGYGASGIFEGCTSLETLIVDGSTVYIGEGNQIENGPDSLRIILLNGGTLSPSKTSKNLSRSFPGIPITIYCDSANENALQVAQASGAVCVAVDAEAELTLPEDVQFIEREAFMGINAATVRINDGATQIGPGAFRDNPQLLLVHIPTSVTCIAADAFDDCPQLVISGSADSEAERYARANHIAWLAR